MNTKGFVKDQGVSLARHEPCFCTCLVTLQDSFLRGSVGLPPACFVEIFTEEEIVSINALPRAIRPHNPAWFQKAKKNYIKFDAKMSNFIFRAPRKPGADESKCYRFN